MATNQQRPHDSAQTSPGVEAVDHPIHDERPDAPEETHTEIVSPFEQGNSIVLAVTQYFDENQPLHLFARETNGRTCLIVEEVPDS